MAEKERNDDKTGKSEGKPSQGKRILLRTFGCQMNFRDSEFVMGLLLENGFKAAESIDAADIILFNSCSVRKHAEDRLISNIGDLSRLKKKRPGLIIGLMGCTAQSYKDKILEKIPLLDFSCGPGNESDLPNILKDIVENRCSIIATDKIDEKRPELFPKYRGEKFKAYVSIGEGCDNFCSYCIVPYARGRERSRDVEDIIREVEDLANRGFKEIILLGQNVNSYGKAVSRQPSVVSFVDLLEKLNKIKGIERIRFMTSHPKDASSALFKAMRDLKKVCEHLHLPLQSGSDRILKRMNRGYTGKKYLQLIDEYKKYLPDGSITTDIIVGFPSESEKDFVDTLDVIKRIGFDGAYMFKYSPRPPARSAQFKDSVSPETKQKRLETLLDAQCKISLARNEPVKGETVEVLVDGLHEKSGSIMTGRTRTNKVVVFEGGTELVGKLVHVHIESVTPHALKGKVVK